MSGFNQFIHSFFSKIFIAIDVEWDECHIRVVRIKNSSILEQAEKRFKVIDGVFPISAVRFIQSYQKISPFCYIGSVSKVCHSALFYPSAFREQSAYSQDSSVQNTDESGHEDSLVKKKSWGENYKEIDVGQWVVRIQNSKLEDIQRFFHKIGGVDYIFSPFILIYNHIQADLDSSLRLYVLNHKNALSILIANKEGVRFGRYVVLDLREFHSLGFQSQNSLQGETQDSPQPDSVKDLDFSFQKESDFDGLSTIDSPENEDRTDFFETTSSEFDVFLSEEDQLGGIEMEDSLLRSQAVARVIEECLAEFYSSELEEDFVEEIVFLTNVDVSEDTLSYIQDKTLLSVQSTRLVLVDALLEAMQEEYRGA